MEGDIIFEYDIVRLGKRIDVILLMPTNSKQIIPERFNYSSAGSLSRRIQEKMTTAKLLIFTKGAV